MSPETITYLSRPGLRRVLFAARERFERNGGPYGRLQLTKLSPDEAHTLNGLLTPSVHSRPAARRGSSFRAWTPSCATLGSRSRSRTHW